MAWDVGGHCIIPRAFPKSPYITLSEAKGLCAEDRILRFAQNDSDFGKALYRTPGRLLVLLAGDTIMADTTMALSRCV